MMLVVNNIKLLIKFHQLTYLVMCLQWVRETGDIILEIQTSTVVWKDLADRRI